MFDLQSLRLALLNIKPSLLSLREALDIDSVIEQLKDLEELTKKESFWNDLELSKITNRKISSLKDKLDRYNTLVSDLDDAITLSELAIDENDTTVALEIKDSFDSICSRIDALSLKTLLTGKYDAKNAILNFHAGAGGTEAQDWVDMLLRMYNMWCDKHGFKFKVLDVLPGEEAGTKSASVMVEGENAFGFLKSEAGVHRIVRISPFDSSGRRHTSFASIEVMPEIDDEINITINEADLRIDTYRASGAGGQHVNKTESAIRITHLPTGVVVSCQNERSQLRNREVAFKMLKSKLVEIKEREHLANIEDIKGDQKDISWGSQIRSYVFMPYTLVKDHRTGCESGNISSVMDGELDPFINAYLKYLNKSEE